DESYPVAELTDGNTEEVKGPNYGPLKALCERACEAAMAGRVLNVRDGLIVGPFDGTDRFTYWVRRVARGGDVLAPGRPDRPVQFIDVRDLAKWIIDMSEHRATGTYNATGPADVLTMERMLEACKSVSRSNARFVWIDDGALKLSKVEPWSEMPLWLPDDDELAG